MCTFYLLATLLYFICHGNSQEDHCFPSEFLESLSMSMKITKAGFHRDLHYSVQWGKVDHDVKALLVQKLPSGVYMDEYQLETLKHDTGLEVLLDSKVDLEAPEYLSSGFTALVFLSGTHEAIIPVHGRYHRPSNSSQKWVKVDIEPPRLLLRSDQSAAFIKGRYCVRLDCRGETPSGTLHLLHRNVLSEAPCTVRNQRLCSWLEVLHLEDAGGVSLEIPVGDSSMTLSVCVGTVLTAALSCAYLLRTVWRHGTF